MRWFTLEMFALVSLLLTTIPEIQVTYILNQFASSSPEDSGHSLGFHHLIGH